jgi:hypothetical protein
MPPGVLRKSRFRSYPLLPYEDPYGECASLGRVVSDPLVEDNQRLLRNPDSDVLAGTRFLISTPFMVSLKP